MHQLISWKKIFSTAAGLVPACCHEFILKPSAIRNWLITLKKERKEKGRKIRKEAEEDGQTGNGEERKKGSGKRLRYNDKKERKDVDKGNILIRKKEGCDVSSFRASYLNSLCQGGRGSLDVLLRQRQVVVERLDPLGHRADLTVDALQLRPHDVVKLVLDDVELHHRVAAEHRRTERQPRVVGASVGPSCSQLKT